MRETSRDRVLVLLSRWRIQAAWGLVLVWIPLARPTTTSILAALPLLGLGIALRLWARGHLERARVVAQTGPYALMRHPLYVGSFCIAIAFALISRRWFLPPVVTVVFLTLYVPKALREEAYLRQRFGVQYAEYARRVGAVYPRRLPTRHPGPSDFRWARVLGHREWKTWLGVVALLAVMYVRVLVGVRH